MTGKYGDFPISSIEQGRCDSCLIFVHYEVILVRQGCFEVGILGKHELRTYILMCQLLYSLCGFHKRGFDNILKPSFIITEWYFLFSSMFG